MNKPRGVASTRRDPHADRVIVDLVPDGRTLFPVGRLDVDTTGLIVLTNDGVLANRLMHPRYGVPKTYSVRVRGKVTRRALASLRQGVVLEDGVTSPADVDLRKQSAKTALLDVTIHEGRKRQVRRMFQALGLPVEELHRRRYGPLSDKGLPPGSFRDLSGDEIDGLRRAGEDVDTALAGEVEGDPLPLAAAETPVSGGASVAAAPSEAPPAEAVAEAADDAPAVAESPGEPPAVASTDTEDEPPSPPRSRRAAAPSGVARARCILSAPTTRRGRCRTKRPRACARCAGRRLSRPTRARPSVSARPSSSSVCSKGTPCRPATSSAWCSRPRRTSPPTFPRWRRAASAFPARRFCCCQEIAVAGAVERCVRVLMHCYLGEGRPPHHVYLHGARQLRLDLPE